MPLWSIPALVALGGLLVVLLAGLGLRAAGPDLRTARRLAAPAEVRVGALLDGSHPRVRTVRVSGRIRCRDPLHAGGGERLVVYHRDVEVLLDGIGWRSLERVREARSFELWDHDGSLTIDPSTVAEPLLTIPSVWRGDVAAMSEPHTSAVRQLESRHGPARGARATTRTINVTDRLLVLARISQRPGRRVELQPPDGGYLITNLALDDVMRLLGGRNRPLMLASVSGIAVGAIVAIGGLVATLGAALLAL